MSDEQFHLGLATRCFHLARAGHDENLSHELAEIGRALLERAQADAELIPAESNPAPARPVREAGLASRQR